jgi:hypothetical protein
MRTKVINTTNEGFLLKEGTAGIFRLVKELKAKDSFTIHVDPNATYREYWCAVKDNDPNAIVLSSDDCQEYKTVQIINEGSPEVPKYNWKGLSRRNGQENDEAVAQAQGAPGPPAPVPEKKPGFLGKILKGFGFNMGTSHILALVTLWPI